MSQKRDKPAVGFSTQHGGNGPLLSFGRRQHSNGPFPKADIRLESALRQKQTYQIYQNRQNPPELSLLLRWINEGIHPDIGRQSDNICKTVLLRGGAKCNLNTPTVFFKYHDRMFGPNST